MNAAERVRAYLTARAAMQAEERLQWRQDPGSVIDEEFDLTSRKYVQLTEADLEAVLQTIQALAQVLSIAVPESDVPSILLTVQDLQNAGPGTVIESSGGHIFQKLTHRWFTIGSAIGESANTISLPARVLS